MAEAFVVFVRYEQELLLLRRSKSDEDYPALWDGVFGLGSSPEEYISRVSDCTGLDAEHLNFVRTGPALGIDKGNRLLDITPVLLVSSSKEVTAGGRYTECEWVDPGEIQTYNTVFTDLNIENSEKLFRELVDDEYLETLNEYKRKFIHKSLDCLIISNKILLL